MLARALEIREKGPAPDDAGIAAILNDLGLVDYFQGKHAQAEPLLKRALEIREKTLGPGHSEVAASLENYAALLRATNRSQEATTLEARALAIRASRAPTPLQRVRDEKCFVASRKRRERRDRSPFPPWRTRSCRTRASAVVNLVG